MDYQKINTSALQVESTRMFNNMGKERTSIFPWTHDLLSIKHSEFLSSPLMKLLISSSRCLLFEISLGNKKMISCQRCPFVCTLNTIIFNIEIPG